MIMKITSYKMVSSENSDQKPFSLDLITDLKQHNYPTGASLIFSTLRQQEMYLIRGLLLMEMSGIESFHSGLDTEKCGSVGRGRKRG